VQAGVAADSGIGFLNGLLAGLTGLPGFIITVWCQMRGWSKDAQRAVFQPVMLAAMAMTALSLTAAGAITPAVIKLYLVGLPALLAGLWLGFKLYGKLDDVRFRKLILFLLLVAGVALVAAQGPSLIRAHLGAPLIASAGAAPVAGEPDFSSDEAVEADWIDGVQACLVQEDPFNGCVHSP
jgi:hypothetical protein